MRKKSIPETTNVIKENFQLLWFSLSTLAKLYTVVLMWIKCIPVVHLEADSGDWKSRNYETEKTKKNFKLV